MPEFQESAPAESDEEVAHVLSRTDLSTAGSQENAEFQKAQIEYLSNRVTVLRAALNSAATELAEYKNAEAAKKEEPDDAEE